MPDSDNTFSLDRRSTLKALGTGAGAVAGIGAISGTAAAWERFDVCFQDCSEVWMIVTEDDLDLGGTDDPPAFAYVIVASGGSAECRKVEFTAESAMTMPDEFGDAPVVTYNAGSSEKILGVLEINHGTGEPTYCVSKNENKCAITATPDLHDASCVPDDHPVCSAGDYCCSPCESGEELLVKYEWSGGKFVTEGSVGNIEPTSWTLDEDGEPVEACFTTDYCEVDAVVKAGQGYETYEDESGAFCVTGITTENPQGKEITQAISNVQFFCETPDDPSVGNSSGSNGKRGEKSKGK